MFRKLVGLVLIIGIVAASSLTAFAGREDGSQSTSGSAVSSSSSSNDTTEKPDFKDLLESVIRDGSPSTTRETLIDITRPDSDSEIVYNKSYNIGWTPKKSDVKVFIAKYNESAGKYQLVSDTNGDSSWDGNKDWYSKEFILRKDTNKFKMVAYRTSQEGDLKLEDIQVSCFTISFAEKSTYEKVKDLTKQGIDKIGSIFNRILFQK